MLNVQGLKKFIEESGVTSAQKRGLFRRIDALSESGRNEIDPTCLGQIFEGMTELKTKFLAQSQTP